MLPVTLSSARVRLDLPEPDDAERMFECCQDPLFERLLTVSWPCLREHAAAFISGNISHGWASDSEYTWALRAPEATKTAGAARAADRFGVNSLRLPSGSIGFWLDGPHRGRGLLPEAQRLVADWAFANRIVDAIRWECLIGTIASARAARTAGFTFTGEAPAVAAHRDGSHPASQQARLGGADDRQTKAGWPEPVLAG